MITMWNVTRFKAHQLESHKRTKPLSRQGVVCSNRTTTRYSGFSGGKIMWITGTNKFHPLFFIK